MSLIKMGRKFRPYTLRRINAKKNQCKKSLNCVWVSHCKRKNSEPPSTRAKRKKYK